jgi:purine-nucleoside phosphorylase
LGAKRLFVTNASGGIRPDFEAGSLMLLTDHISCFVPNPLIGPNPDELGTRFPDMSEAYDADLRRIVRDAANKNGIELREGVYVQLTGPSFETPAEIRMLSRMGADAVGMSTVVEVIAARHAGMRVVGVSCVSNLAAGISPTPLSAEEVIAAGAAAAPRFQALLWDSIAAMHEEEES